MSRAFVKEDVGPPERTGRARSASGLPPGAVNYITARGAAQLRDNLRSLSGSERAQLKELLDSVTVVHPPEDRDQIAFGAKVAVQDSKGEMRSYHIVGVDELDQYDDAVSWISPDGKALLAGNVGDRVALRSCGSVKIVAVEYPEK